jgi:hypothetical protein
MKRGFFVSGTLTSEIAGTKTFTSPTNANMIESIRSI